MKDLAIQAANGVNGDSEFGAQNAEYTELKAEFTRILTQTTYGSGTKLFVESYSAEDLDPDDNPLTNDAADAQIVLGGSFGKFTGTAAASDVEYTGIQFQIGASEDETLTVHVGEQIAKLASAVADVLDGAGEAIIGDETAFGSPLLQSIDSQANASAQISVLDGVLANIGEVRSTLGANINRLDHTINNLTSIQENTAAAKGRITDADFALETSNMTKQQMLMQAGMSILAQSNQMSGLVMSLLR
jgi:flagellin